MNRIAFVAGALVLAACSHYRAGDLPEPSSPAVALDRFLAAVRAKDAHAMGDYWGNANGPWHDIRATYRDSVMMAFQVFLRHDSYRIVDGPTMIGDNPNLVTFHVELQAPGCVRTQPFDAVKTKAGGWLLINVHLEAESNVVPHCPKP